MTHHRVHYPLSGYRKFGSHLPSFVLILFFLLFSCSVSANASTGDITIGVVMTGNTSYYAKIHESFVKNLHHHLADTETFNILLQRPFPDPIALSNAARKIIAADVVLIVTYGSPATLAVLQEKSSIPVVYAGVYAPEKIAIKGRYVTGCGYKVPLSSLLRYLKSLKKISSLQIIYCSLEEDSTRQKNEVLSLVQQSAIKVDIVNFRGPADKIAFQNAPLNDAVFITGSSIINMSLADLLLSIKKKNQPSVSILPDQSEQGIVITLFHPPYDQGNKAAILASRIIHGDNPRELKSTILRNTELFFNLRAARELGLKFPIKLISAATTVIK